MCFGAFAPGTTSPSIDVVTKILFSHTIGDEWPRPSIGVFHLMFFVVLHSAGRFFSLEIPEPSGPRHCGQFPAEDEAVAAIPNDTLAIRARLIRLVSFTAFFLCSLLFLRNGRFAKSKQMRDGANDQQPVRDCGRRHHHLAYRVLREQL